MRKIWDIHGGVHPPENKSQSNGSPIARLPLPPELIVPLNQHIGHPAEPLVNVGDHVLKGQLIGDAVGIFSATIHAPTSGTITDIEDRVVPHPSGMSAKCVVIKPDGEDTWCDREACEDPMSLPRETLVEKIRQAGIAGMGGAGFPTAIKLQPKSTQSIDTLILNGTECEPYITADDRLMREHADEIVAGMLLLAKILGQPKHLMIGIEDNKPEALEIVRNAAQNTSIEVVSFPTKYPSGGEKQLIQILTGKEVPAGKIPAQIGIVMQNVGTAFAAWRAVKYGEPLIERVTTLVGETLATQGNAWVLIGTPIEYLLAQYGHQMQPTQRVVMGGPMMGFALPDLRVPLIKTTNCILAPSQSELPPPPPVQPCIRCGMCSEACPANLLPQQLYWYARSEDQEKLKAHNLFDCIECGACSFVCPSAIPLVQYYRAAKGLIRQHDADKLKSDRARVRFETRKERVMREEEAKEAKRLQRKKAAEEAKKKLEAQKLAKSEHDKAVRVYPTETQPTNVSVDSSATADSVVATDIVSKAVAKVSANQNDAATEQKKLERTVASTEGKIERLKSQVETAETEQRKAVLSSQLKQLTLKLDETKARMLSISAGADTATKEQHVPAEAPADASAAAKAIERAKAQREASANQSEEEKRNQKVASLRKRLSKAEVRLQEAIAGKSEHVEALQNSVETLKQKLDELTES